jgi:predicted MFS family arabinose efflux permease
MEIIGYIILGCSGYILIGLPLAIILGKILKYIGTFYKEE